jgi:hypothetical protein
MRIRIHNPALNAANRGSLFTDMFMISTEKAYSLYRNERITQVIKNLFFITFIYGLVFWFPESESASPRSGLRRQKGNPIRNRNTEQRSTYRKLRRQKGNQTRNRNTEQRNTENSGDKKEIRPGTEILNILHAL